MTHHASAGDNALAGALGRHTPEHSPGSRPPNAGKTGPSGIQIPREHRTTRAARQLSVLLVLVVSLLGLSGCASLGVQTELERLPDRVAAAGLPRAVQLDGVPFFPDERFYCGPAVTASVLGHAFTTASDGASDARPTLEALIDEVFVPARNGAFQAEIRAAVRARDLVALRLADDLDAILRAVTDGYPVAVFQNLGLRMAPQWHYAVVIGYDLERERIVEHSGPHEALDTRLATFAHVWNRGGRWAFIAVSPDQPPAWVRPFDWLRAVNELEQNGRFDAALRGYTAIAERLDETDPFSDEYWVAVMAKANVHDADGRPQDAARVLLELLNRSPEDRIRDATWNNLAHALADAGFVEAGREAARCAITIAERRLTDGSNAYTPTRMRFFPDGMPDARAQTERGLRVDDDMSIVLPSCPRVFTDGD